MDIADEVLIMPREERKIFRQTHGYNIVSKTGDFEELKREDDKLRSNSMKLMLSKGMKVKK